MAHKIVLCGPSTLIAVLQVVRQAIDSFNIERRSNDIMACLADFKKEWEKFSDQIDKHGKQLNTAMNSFNELAGARSNQLGRHVNKIDAIQAAPISATTTVNAVKTADAAGPAEANGAVEMVGEVVKTAEAPEALGALEPAELEVVEAVQSTELEACADDSDGAGDDATDATDADVIATGELWPPLRDCLLYTSPSPRDQRGSRMPSSA